MRTQFLFHSGSSASKREKLRAFTWGSTAVAAHRDEVTRGNRILFSAGDILESITLKLEEEPAGSRFTTRGRRGFLSSIVQAVAPRDNNVATNTRKEKGFEM